MTSTRIRQVVETLRAGLVALGLAVLGFLVGKWTAKGGESPILPRVERPLPGQAQESSEQKAATERDKRARGLRTALRRLLTGGLVVLLSMGFAGSLGCGAEEVSDQPYIPQTYDELLKYYREAVSLLQRYDVLYQEADASNKALLQANAELRALVKKQQDFIATRDGRGRFGVIGGVTSARGSLGLLLGVLWTP